MDSAVQLANKLVDKVRGLQQRQDAALETWRGLIAEMERQANACGEVVQNALEQPENGARAVIWSKHEELKREGPTLTVFLGERTSEGTETESLAMARFYVDPSTCRVVADRKRPGIPEKNKRGRSGFKNYADLGDVQDISLGTFVAELLRFLEWTLVGEGKGRQPWRLAD